ncbi:hypothetical protein BDR26DRAFT_857127 [Obelidium mucronatum]|nr:hypothetical protein BDR26DRAFT_857127 [Obelidium mucronatum]
MKQRKPVENPPPLPPRKDTRPIVTREVTYVQPSIPRLFVQLIDLRLKTSTQAFNVYCTIQVGNQVYFSSPLPLSQESRKGFGLVICPREGFLFDIPSIDPPSPYPILIQIHKGPPPPNNAISNIQTMSQKPITYSSSSNLSYSSTKAASKHRRKKSNDSVAHSIASISSTFSNFKTGLMRGIRGNTNNANVDGSGNGGGGGGGAGNRRMTLNISSPFRSKHPQTTTKAMASSIATSSATLLPPSDNILPAAAEATAAVSAASSKHQTASTAAPPFEPTYDIPCYYGSTICKSESHSNLFHYGNDDVPDVVIPETLLGQVVLVPQLNGDAKATFEKVVYNMEPEGAFGLSSLKLGGTKKSEKEVAIVSVQVGMFLDETYPLIVEIPPVEYSTFLNFQMSNRGGGIWKKYWVMIKKGIMHVYDFEYKENKPMISWVPLQGHLARISRPDPEEMCALNCLQLDFMTPFADQEVSLQPHEQRWRDAVVEASGIAYVTAETKDAMVELENILREFI